MSIIRGWTPFYWLWLAERKRHAVTKADLEAHRRYFALAVAQRDAALDVAAGKSDRPLWNEADEALLGAWLDGERPA